MSRKTKNKNTTKLGKHGKTQHWSPIKAEKPKKKKKKSVQSEAEVLARYWYSKNCQLLLEFTEARWGSARDSPCSTLPFKDQRLPLYRHSGTEFLASAKSAFARVCYRPMLNKLVKNRYIKKRFTGMSEPTNHRYKRYSSDIFGRGGKSTIYLHNLPSQPNLHNQNNQVE